MGKNKSNGKDPAMLWYWGDWNNGTATLTRHQKGCYMDLLNAQFHTGPLSLEEIKVVLGQDQAVWTVLSKKFSVDPAGRFYNERLELERDNRKKYTESRRNNLKGKEGSHMEPHMKSHMENEIVNENKNRYAIEEGGMGETDSERWTQQVLSGNDNLFAMLFENDFPGHSPPEELIKKHEAACLRNKWHFASQTHFRKSLLQYIISCKKSENNGKPSKSNTKEPALSGRITRAETEKYLGRKLTPDELAGFGINSEG